MRPSRQRIVRRSSAPVKPLRFAPSAYAAAGLTGPRLRRISSDYVIALDRFSRDQEDTAGLFKRLTFAGVNIVTLAEGALRPAG